jgi:hypothetical protein
MTSTTTSYPQRYEQAQRNRTLIHPRLPQPPMYNDKKEGTTTTTTSPSSSPPTSEEQTNATTTTTTTTTGHSFVVCADTQLGMYSGCEEWETELAYSRQAIHVINQIEPRPAFCCMCGDLVDMEHTFFAGKEKGGQVAGGEKVSSVFTKEECDAIQDQQNEDFKQTWAALHNDIAMVCLCGNHGAFLCSFIGQLHQYCLCAVPFSLCFFVLVHSTLTRACHFSLFYQMLETDPIRLAWTNLQLHLVMII